MTALDEDRFLAALDIIQHRRLCAHEAGHAAAALLGGLDVQSAYAGFHRHADLEHADLDGAAGTVMIVVGTATGSYTASRRMAAVTVPRSSSRPSTTRR